MVLLFLIKSGSDLMMEVKGENSLEIGGFSLIPPSAGPADAVVAGETFAGRDERERHWRRAWRMTT